VAVQQLSALVALTLAVQHLSALVALTLAVQHLSGIPATALVALTVVRTGLATPEQDLAVLAMVTTVLQRAATAAA